MALAIDITRTETKYWLGQYQVSDVRVTVAFVSILIIIVIYYPCVLYLMTSSDASWLGSRASADHDFFNCEICCGLNERAIYKLLFRFGVRWRCAVCGGGGGGGGVDGCGCGLPGRWFPTGGRSRKSAKRKGGRTFRYRLKRHLFRTL